METLMSEISKLLDEKNNEIQILKWRVELLESQLQKEREKNEHNKGIAGICN